MPWGAVLLKPGVNTDLTPTANEAGYSESNLIRFRANLAEKVGGWVKYYPFAVGGTPRDLHAWQDFNGDDHLAVGSTTLLGVITDDELLTLTPQTKTTEFGPDFTTLSGSANVTVTDVNVTNVTTYDSVEFKTPISVGGVILSGVYPIDLVLSANSYRIVAATEATSTVSNTGATPSFATTSGSTTVTVTFANHGLSVGSEIVFPLSTTVGGTTVSGTYAATSVPTANTFTIVVDTPATSSTSGSMNSGNCRLVYYIALGPSTAASGYSIGTYSSGAYSTGATGSAQTGTPITATDWTFDNWGSTLLSCPEGGGVYEWTPGTGLTTAKLVSGAPLFNGGVFVAAPAQILIAWGSTVPKAIGIARDPLTYAWSDQLDYTFWTAGVVNPATGNISQAGSARIPTGSKIVAGMQAPQQALLWTDLDLWAVNYIGAPDQGLTFGQTKVGASCGTVGAHAVGQLGRVVYWMGASNFFMFSGSGVVPVPCTVWDAVFQDLDLDNAWKVRAAPNTPFNEMWWFYPSLSGGTGENDSYVKVNVTNGAWDYGPVNALARSAWIDQSVLGKPIGASPQGVIYQHETTRNADGAPIQWSFRTGYWSITDAEQVAFVDQVIPDFIYGPFNSTPSATLSITLYAVMYPGGAETTYGPYTIDSDTTFVSTRLRGRQMAMQVSGADLDSFVRLGRVRFRFAPDGRQ